MGWDVRLHHDLVDEGRALKSFVSVSVERHCVQPEDPLDRQAMEIYNRTDNLTGTLRRCISTTSRRDTHV